MRHKIIFDSINVDGEVKHWEMEPNKLYDIYFNGDADLPDLGDTITECVIKSNYDDTNLFVYKFSDLMAVLFGKY